MSSYGSGTYGSGTYGNPISAPAGPNPSNIVAHGGAFGRTQIRGHLYPVGVRVSGRTRRKVQIRAWESAQ